ncbi:ribonuclease HII [Candidatus Woesearchaeota archaeon]|nr:ribonuclease HII [Candidatus Woesearchaeota archaeon]
MGPLVTAGVLIDEKDESKLKTLGVKDSKLLTPEQREVLFKKITAVVKDYSIKIIQPYQIDAALNDPDLNLNWLEANTMADLANELKPKKIILDCPSNNIPAFTNYLKNKLKIKAKIIAEHKADQKYPVVAAASILAKVTRDKEIEKIKNDIKQNLGSGYPSDPTTQEFLKKNYKKYPKIFRKTWSSYQRLVEQKKQKSLSDF